MCKDPVRTTKDPGGQGRINYVGMTNTSCHSRILSDLKNQRLLVHHSGDMTETVMEGSTKSMRQGS